MALNPELITFFLRNIQRANMETFGSEVAHLFEHLDNEIKTNPVFEKYQLERKNGKNGLVMILMGNGVYPPNLTMLNR